MRRAALRMTVCISTAAATAVLGALAAPAASADPDREGVLPPQVSTQAYAPSVLPLVPPFGRKIS